MVTWFGGPVRKLRDELVELRHHYIENRRRLDVPVTVPAAGPPGHRSGCGTARSPFGERDTALAVPERGTSRGGSV